MQFLGRLDETPFVIGRWHRGRFEKKKPDGGRVASGKIAVIGMAGRCAGAGNIDEFWELLRQGKDGIETIEEQSWLDCFAAHSSAPVPTRYGRMAGKEHFDAAFFGIGRDEAAVMDLPQRLLLEDTYHALEDAGIAPPSLQKQAVGVFIGSVGGGAQSTDGASPPSGVDTSVLSSRIAYYLDLKGPALTVNTACSSSLVAMDVACQYLRNGIIDLAIVGGATVYTDPRTFIQMNKAGILSPSGACRPFDRNANGMVVGDGSGVVILKRLEEAERDRDPIYGAIAAIGINQNGQTAGMSVPSYLSQSQLQSSLYRTHQIDAEAIQYIEAHGTATQLGDPIEIDALKHSFQQFTAKKRYCAIGSVKANIGHTTAASGVLSVIKVLMSFKHRLIPATLNFEQSNEHIDFDDSPFYVNTGLQEWPENGGKPRLAAVTSLGHSGTNAHLVLEEYLPVLSQPEQPEAYLIPLSAKTPESLEEYALKLASYIRRNPAADLNALAYTLQVGREGMSYRSIFLLNDRDELARKLEQFGRGEAPTVIDGHWQGVGKQKPCTVQDLGSLSLPALAERWADGESIEWQVLYRGNKPQRLHLPGYVFAESSPSRMERKKPVAVEKNTAPKEQRLEELLKNLLARQLACPADRIDAEQTYFELGLDSLGIMNMQKALEKLSGRKIAPSVLFEYRTLKQLSAYLQEGFIDNAPWPSESSSMPTCDRFPELVLLNDNRRGRPVFWIHGGLGGVQPYYILAEVSERPFYGIQARGWSSEQAPIRSVPAMASYYIEAMQSVQTAGPYDLGGYSLGGQIAYEITRQLQERGESVSTLTMLDTFDTRGIEEIKHSAKNDFLQAVNIALQTTVMQNPEAFSSTLIHRDQLDCSLDDEAFLQQLLDLARMRGLPYSEQKMHALIQKQAAVQSAHEAHRYRILPLSDPGSVRCYYFRNQGGVYMGELEPYFVLEGYKPDLDHKNHASIWQQQLPDFTLTDLNVSNHLVLLAEPEACKVLTGFIRELYSDAGDASERLNRENDQSMQVGSEIVE